MRIAGSNINALTMLVVLISAGEMRPCRADDSPLALQLIATFSPPAPRFQAQSPQSDVGKEPRPDSGQTQPWTLERLVEVAISGHPSVLAKRAEAAAAEAGVDEAKWQFFPTPSISADRIRGNQKEVVSVYQPLWAGGRLTTGLDLAKSRLDVANLSVAEMRRSVAEKVAQAWSGALGARVRVQAFREGVAQLESLELMMRRRIATGLSGQAELDLLLARLAQARSDLAQASADERSAGEALSQLIGEPVPVSRLSVARGGRLPLGSNERQSLVEQGLSADPTLRRLAAESDSAEIRIDRERAERWPKVYARLDYQHGEYLGSSPAGSHTYVGLEHSFGAGLSVGAKVRVAVQAAEAARETHVAAQRDVKARIVADVESYAAALEGAANAGSNLMALNQVLDSYRRMFLAGRRGWLDLLNMIKEQTEAARQAAAADVQVAYLAFRLRLHRGDFVNEAQ